MTIQGHRQIALDKLKDLADKPVAVLTLMDDLILENDLRAIVAYYDSQIALEAMRRGND